MKSKHKIKVSNEYSKAFLENRLEKQSDLRI